MRDEGDIGTCMFEIKKKCSERDLDKQNMFWFEI